RSHAPLFQVMFALQNQEMGGGGVPLGGEVSLEPLGTGSGTAKFDLTFALLEAAGGYAGDLEYNTDLFDAATLDRFLGHYARLLEGAIAAPALPVADLPLLAEAERTELLISRGVASDYPGERPLAALFEAEAARHPEAPAIVWGERRWSYAELEAQASA